MLSFPERIDLPTVRGGSSANNSHHTGDELPSILTRSSKIATLQPGANPWTAPPFLPGISSRKLGPSG